MWIAVTYGDEPVVNFTLLEQAVWQRGQDEQDPLVSIALAIVRGDQRAHRQVGPFEVLMIEAAQADNRVRHGQGCNIEHITQAGTGVDQHMVKTLSSQMPP